MSRADCLAELLNALTTISEWPPERFGAALQILNDTPGYQLKLALLAWLSGALDARVAALRAAAAIEIAKARGNEPLQ